MARKIPPQKSVEGASGKSGSKAKSGPKPKAKSRTTKKGLSTPDSLEPSPSLDGSEPETKREDKLGYVPDPIEWADPAVFIAYNSFRRQGAGGSMRVGEFIYIWGNNGDDLEIDPSERTRWLGKIMAIRAAAKDKVFMEVAWLYTSADQLKESGISFPQKVLGENECVISDLRDVMSVWCAEERATVKRFDELDPWQEDIDEGDEYYRSEVVSDRAGRLKVVSIRANSKGRKSYKPLPLGSTPMVYCPRPGCLKWHHQAQTKKIQIASDEQLLEMQSTGLELLDTRPPRSDPPPSNHQLPEPASTEDNHTTELSNVPEEEEGSNNWEGLVRSASSSITRGSQSIVGNTIPTIEAREVVAAKENGEGRWEVMMKRWFEKYDADEEDEEARYICPGCRGVI